MSGVITAVLNVTIGLLVNKARDFTAQKLREGDVTDELCRKFIVRELDDIKSKLDGLARKDLLSSVSFLKEGVCLLNICLDKSSHDETRQDIEQAEAVIREPLAVALSHEIRRLNISSGKRFQSAKAKFEKSNTEATRAFNSEALSTEDRIFATKLRMISTILENLEDPDAAASACQLYLRALHAMPAVREIFSVHASGGMKSLFYKTKRLENVKSVTMINYVLFHFIGKFTKTQRPGVFSWPGIDIGKRSYYPLYEESEILANMGVESPCHTLTCDVEAAGDRSSSAVNSKREIIVRSKVSGNVNVLNSQGEIKLFWSLPQEDKEARGFDILSLAIDCDDNVYIVTIVAQTDDVYNYKLSVFDPEGILKHEFPLEFLSGEKEWIQIAINMAKNIIIHKSHESRVHVCNKDGQLQYSFPLDKNIHIYRVCLSSSDQNEIVAARRLGNTVYIYTELGELKRTIELPKDHKVRGLAFNHGTKNIIVYSVAGHAFFNFVIIVYYLVGHLLTFHFTSSFLSYSETGELQTLPSLPDDRFGDLTSHPSGPVAFVHDKRVLYLT